MDLGWLWLMATLVTYDYVNGPR